MGLMLYILASKKIFNLNCEDDSILGWIFVHAAVALLIILAYGFVNSFGLAGVLTAVCIVGGLSAPFACWYAAKRVKLCYKKLPILKTKVALREKKNLTFTVPTEPVHRTVAELFDD
jgi:hypothetical protein